MSNVVEGKVALQIGLRAFYGRVFVSAMDGQDGLVSTATQHTDKSWVDAAVVGVRAGLSLAGSTSGITISEVKGMPVDTTLGRRRARAAALLEFALPGPAYIYQGEELGLPEVEDLPDEVRDDPSFFRTGGRVAGRDGCRVPLPWSGTDTPYGFGTDASPWLPQPAEWADLSVAAQDGVPDSTLSLYRHALAIRSTHPALGDGTLAWSDEVPGHVLYFTREPGFGCLVNLSADPVALPGGARVLVASGPLEGGLVPTDTAVWLDLA